MPEPLDFNKLTAENLYALLLFISGHSKAEICSITGLTTAQIEELWSTSGWDQISENGSETKKFILSEIARALNLSQPTPNGNPNEALAHQTQRLDELSIATKTGGWEVNLLTGDVYWTKGCNFILNRESDALPLPREEYAAFVHPDDRNLHVEAIQNLYREGTPFDICYRINVGDEVKFVRSIAQTELNENGDVVRLFGTVQDVSDLSNERLHLRETQAFYSKLAESVPDRIYVYDLADGEVVYSNITMAEMLGYSREEEFLLGDEIHEHLIHPEDKAKREARTDILLDLPDGEFYEMEYRMRHSTGKWASLSSKSGVFRRDESGKPIQSIGVVRDVTARKEMEEALRKNEEVVRRTIEDAPLGIGTTNLDGIIEQVNPAFCAIVGFAPEELIGQNIASLDTPQELEAFVDWIIRQRCETDVEPLRREKAITRRDGSVIWVYTITSVVHGADGGVVRLVVQLMDITAKKEAEERERQTHRVFRAALESLQDGVLLLDKGQIIQVANPRAGEIIGIDHERLIGLPIERMGKGILNEDLELVSPESTPLYRALQGETVTAFEFAIERDGVYKWLRCNAAPVYRADEAEPYAAVISFLDINLERSQRLQLVESLAQVNDLNKQLEKRKEELELHQVELEHSNRQLHQLAVTDGLTGLCNHRRAVEFLEQKLAVANRYKRPLSIAMIDVDRFKLLNDNHGHLAGDMVLKAVAEVMDRTLRKTDLLARYGGEEFLAILPETNGEEALLAGERIRAAIATEDIGGYGVTVSIGISFNDCEVQAQTDLIARADRAMYASKQAGRNKVTFYPPEGFGLQRTA